MHEDPAERFYTLLGVRVDGEIPTVDVIAATGDADALARATAWLDGRQTCRRVEVWSEGVVIGVLHSNAEDEARP